jgi:hypothetical protein
MTNAARMNCAIALTSIAMLTVALAKPGAQRGGRGGGGNANEGVPVATETILAHPDLYYGRPVTVSAGVEQMLTTTAFVVDQRKATGEKGVTAIGKPILVLAPYLTTPLDQQNYILIHGSVVNFDAALIAKIATDYKLTLPGEIRAKYAGEPVLLATSIRTSTFAEVAKKPIPAPTPQELTADAVMKVIGPASTALQAAVQASTLDVVIENATKLQAAFAQTAPVWTDLHQRSAALWAEEAREDAVAVQSAAAAGDLEKVKKTAATLGLTCGTCHSMFREREDDGTYRIKLATLP